jgi:hypothetical protein
MDRTSTIKSRDDLDARTAQRTRAAVAPQPGGERDLTPSELHAAHRSATLTAAQSRRRGVMPG